MRKWGWIAAGVVLGTVLANLTIAGLELLLQQLPIGRAIDLSQAGQPGFMDTVPLAAKLWVAAGWGIGAFIGALAAFRLSRTDVAGWIVAALVAAAGLVNVVLIEHPLWMRLCAVADPFIGAVLAFGVYRRWRAAALQLRRQ